MRKHKKLRNIWEYLKIGENTSGNFSEFLAIPIIESLEETVFEIYGNYWKLQKHTGHVTDLVLPGEGIFESFFAQDWDIWLPTQMKRTDTEHVSCFHTSCMHDTVCNDLEIMEATKNKQKLSGFCCFVFKFCLF